MHFCMISQLNTGNTLFFIPLFKQQTLLEQNEKLGKKLFITGKGRCNLTNASDMEQLFANVVSNRKFLYSAFYSYDNEQVISFFESHGMPTKTERWNGRAAVN